MGSVLVPLGDAVLIPQYQYAVSEAAHPSRHPPSTLLRQQQHRSGTIAPRIHAPPPDIAGSSAKVRPLISLHLMMCRDNTSPAHHACTYHKLALNRSLTHFREFYTHIARERVDGTTNAPKFSI